MRCRPLVPAGIVLLGWVSLRAGRGQETPPGGHWIRFETASESALPIVEARLNGSEGYRLALDFTVSEVLLDTFLVVGAGLELPDHGETAVVDYYGAKEKLPVVYIDSLELDGVTRRAVRALLIEGDALGAHEGTPTYGRIGRGFLDQFRLTVHYPRKLLLLEPSPEGEVPPGGAPFETEGRLLVVGARVNQNLEARLVIDPGASVSFVDRDWAVRQGLAGKKDQRVEIATLEMGGFTARAVAAIVEDMSGLPYRTEAQGVIGASFLRDRAVTYDFPRSLVWFRGVGGGPS